MFEVTVQQVTEYMETNLIPKICQSLGKSNKNVKHKISFPKDTFFVSCVCFLDLSFDPNEKQNGNASDNNLKLVIKRPPLDDAFAEHMNMSVHFHNEILFYTKFARGNPRFPRLILAVEDTPENTVIVTENMSPHGYEICPEAYDVPIEYVFSAVEEIARLHAIAYAMKEKEPEEFKKITDVIQEARFIPGGWISQFLDGVSSRSVPWLRKNNVDPKFCDKIEKFFDNAFNEIMLPGVRPVEPLATLCHGDFTRNNIFFRRVDGKLEAMLIDFALIGYSSPGIDISTFLYLNCSTSDRVNNFDKLFRSYHDTLLSGLREAGIEDLDKYSYDKMLAEYKRTAAFGYVIAVFFLPVVMDPTFVDIELVKEDPKAGARLTRKAGGQKLDELFGKMILELRDTGCLDHVC